MFSRVMVPIISMTKLGLNQFNVVFQGYVFARARTKSDNITAEHSFNLGTNSAFDSYNSIVFDEAKIFIEIDGTLINLS